VRALCLADLASSLVCVGPSIVDFRSGATASAQVRSQSGLAASIPPRHRNGTNPNQKSECGCIIPSTI
jgi:hypothetical protein